jgi:phosphatidylserine/phosphatidylglycerophosphate/cardiolipin synthase-like enzyme
MRKEQIMPRRRSSRTRISFSGVFLLLIVLAAINYLSTKSGGPGIDLGPILNPGATAVGPFAPGGSQPASGNLPAWLTVYFTDPNPPDNVGAGVDRYIVPLLDGATQTIDLTSFDLNLPSVLDALVSASGRGVRVRVVYDGENGETQLDADKSPTGEDINAVTMLKNAGIPLVDGGRSNGLMHNKMIIVDGKTLVMGSWNTSYNDTYRNNNNVLVISDPTLIANYQAKFNESFEARQFGAQAEVGARTPVLTAGGARVANYFSPPDQVMEKLVSLVGSARTSIRFMAFTYTHQDLADAMIARHNAGVDVAGIFESRASTQGAMVPLFCAGIPVRVDGNGYTMHHKVIIIDDHIVITGSFNFTVSADDSNDDNLLVIDSPALAQLYLQEYQRLDAIADGPDTTSDNFKEAQAEKCP